MPTPFVPYAVDHYTAACGIMVTASHNPKDDNGYKLYWANGCQIVPPQDLEIQRCIQDHVSPWIRDISMLKSITASRNGLLKYAQQQQQQLVSSSSSLLNDPLDQITTSYYAQIKAQLCRYPAENAQVHHIHLVDRYYHEKIQC